MSSTRSRRGGMRTSSTLSRKKRSSRNRPAATSAPRSRLVAASSRTSVGTGRTDPRGSTTRSWMARSSLAWSDRGRSPTSSRNRVPPWANWNRPGLSLAAPVNAPLT